MSKNAFDMSFSWLHYYYHYNHPDATPFSDNNVALAKSTQHKIDTIDFNKHKLLHINDDYCKLFDAESAANFSCLAERHARAESANGRFCFNETISHFVLTDPTWLGTMIELIASSPSRAGDYAHLGNIVGPNVPVWKLDEFEKKKNLHVSFNLVVSDIYLY